MNKNRSAQTAKHMFNKPHPQQIMKTNVQPQTATKLAVKTAAGDDRQSSTLIIPEERQMQVTELIYLLYFSLLLGARVLGFIEGETVYNIIFVVSMLLFLVKLILTDHSILEYFLIALFMLTALIVYRNTGEKGLILNFSLMLGLKGVSQKKVIRSAFLITAFGMMVMFFLSSTGLISDLYYYQDRGHIKDFRHALGYSHPNSAQDWAVLLIFLYMLLVGKSSVRAVLRASLLSFLFSTFIYFYTGSRTGWIITAFYLLLNLVLMSRGHLSKIGSFLCIAEYPVLVVASIAVPLLDQTKLYALLLEKGNTLGARASIASFRWQTNGIRLFGNRFDYSEMLYGVDISYLYLLLNLGIIPLVLISVLYIGTIWDQVRSQRLEELGVTVSLLIMGMTDPLLFNMSTKNLIMIFAGTWMFRETGAFQKHVLEGDGAVRRTMSSLLFREPRWRIGKPQMVALPTWAVRFALTVSDGCRTAAESRRTFWRILTIFLGSAGVCAILFGAAVSRPVVVYSNQNTSEQGYLIEGLEEVYMTPEDVIAARRQGDLVIGYQNETVPMYIYEGDVPMHEYLRRMMSVAAMAGIVASSLSLAVRETVIQKKKRQCRR